MMLEISLMQCLHVDVRKKNRPRKTCGYVTEWNVIPGGGLVVDIPNLIPPWSHTANSLLVMSDAPGQGLARRIFRLVSALRGQTADIAWVKGHVGTPGNERADQIAGGAAEKLGPYTSFSLAHLKLRISGRYSKAKEAWHANPRHHGTMETPPPLPKKSMLDRARNAVARVAA